MGKNNKNLEPFDLGCPHCGANLKVDAEIKAVIAHTPPVRPKTFNDFEEATRAMKEQDSRRESLFQQSVAAQKNSADLLEKKFQEAMKRAKETPDSGKPLRDIDLG
jgi:protein-disulfide isomerase